MKKGVFGLLAGLWMALAGCDQSAVYKGVDDLEDGKWYVNKPLEFKFSIDDTTARYAIYYNIRNSVSYPYYNLYIRRSLLDSAGNTLQSRLDQMILLDPKTGKPFGDGLGDLFDHRISMGRNYSFPRTGPYTIQLRQYMRQNPLPEIYSVGVTVEKEAPKQ